jgi:hypothetical protein
MPPKTPPIVKTTIRVPRELWRKVRIAAINRGEGTSEIIVRLLTDFAEREERKGAKR